MPSGIVSFSNYFANLLGADDPKPSRKPSRRAAPARKTQGRQQVPVQTKREAIAETARRVAARRQDGASKFGTAFAAGVGRGAFGIPERLAAAGLRYLPSAVTGNTSDASYDDILELVRATTDESLKGSTPGNILGQLVGGGAAGGAAVGVGRQVVGRAAAAGVPGARAVQTTAALQRGQKFRNAARISAAGAVGGAVQAAGEGRDDIGTSAAIGAAAAPAVFGGVKVAEYLSRPVRDVLRASSAGGILRRFTTSTREQIEEAAAAFRKATGTEPTVFELLPQKDRQAIIGDVVGPNTNVVEQATEAIRRRASKVGPEMAGRVEEIVAPQRRLIEREMVNALGSARGAPDAADPALAGRAASSPTDMLELRSAEARAIMGPFDDQQIFNDVGDLIPSTYSRTPSGGIVQEPDPELSSIIRNAAGSLRLREGGLSVREVTGIMEKLRTVVARGGNEGNQAQRAINHIEDTIDTARPDVGAAVARMNETFAGRSRMAEGMREGVQNRLRDEVQVGTGSDKARTVRNAYDTPEGLRGRVFGASNRLAGDLSGTPDEALRTIQDVARSGGTQRALAENVGDQPSKAIVDAAEAQERSVRALASASREASRRGVEDTDLDKLGTAIVALNPTTFASTRIWALRRLVRMTHIPESRARQLTDLLFSQDPAKTRAALDLFNSRVRDGSKFVRELGMAVTVGQQMAVDRGGGDLPEHSAFGDDPAAPEAPTDFPDDLSGLSDEELLQLDEEYSQEFPDDLSGLSDEELLDLDEEYAPPYGVSAVLSIYPEAQITDAIRDPKSKLGRENLDSYHVRTDGAVDVRPIPGMTFEQFVQGLRDAGYNVIEAIDEVKRPSKHATGPHWHVAFG